MLRELGLYRRKKLTEREVYPALVEALYFATGPLIAAALAGAVYSVVVAAASGDPWLWTCAVALCLVGAARIWTIVHFQQRRAAAAFDPRREEALFALGGLVTAMLVGLYAGLTLLRTEGEVLHLFVMGSTTAYAAGVSSSSASRPRLAAAQLSLTLLPFAAALGIGPHRF